MKTKSNTNAGSGCQARLVRLQQCSKRSCGHIYPEDETVYVKKPNGCDSQGTCPKCGCKTYHLINPDGSTPESFSDWKEIDLATLPTITLHPKASKCTQSALARMVAALLSDCEPNANCPPVGAKE